MAPDCIVMLFSESRWQVKKKEYIQVSKDRKTIS